MIASFGISGCSEQHKTAKTAKYKDPSLPVGERVDDLLGRMTLEEKVAQTQAYWRHFKNDMLDDMGDLDHEKAGTLFKEGYGIGQISLHYDEGGGKDARGMAELTNELQDFVVENNRLGIPALFHGECLHGHAALGGTSFPKPV